MHCDALPAANRPAGHGMGTTAAPDVAGGGQYNPAGQPLVVGDTAPVPHRKPGAHGTLHCCSDTARVDTVDRVDGTAPVRLLLHSDSVDSEGREDRNAGTVPDRRLPSSRRDVSVDSSVSDDGMEPVRLLPARFRDLPTRTQGDTQREEH